MRSEPIKVRTKLPDGSWVERQGSRLVPETEEELRELAQRMLADPGAYGNPADISNWGTPAEHDPRMIVLPPDAKDDDFEE